MTKPNSIGRKYIQSDFNYILNTAKQASTQASHMRQKREELAKDIGVLDNLEEACLEALKKLTGKDYRDYAMEHNYGKRK